MRTLLFLFLQLWIWPLAAQNLDILARITYTKSLERQGDFILVHFLDSTQPDTMQQVAGGYWFKRKRGELSGIVLGGPNRDSIRRISGPISSLSHLSLDSLENKAWIKNYRYFRYNQADTRWRNVHGMLWVDLLCRNIDRQNEYSYPVQMPSQAFFGIANTQEVACSLANAAMKFGEYVFENRKCLVPIGEKWACIFFAADSIEYFRSGKKPMYPWMSKFFNTKVTK